MKEVNELPPNYGDVLAHFELPEHPLFCWGDTLYNPGGKPVPSDIWVHEDVHRQQQEAFGSIEAWWMKYLTDADFRLEQELEAYAAQYQFVKKYMAHSVKDALFEFAEQLSSPQYDLGIEHLKAENMIRLKAKQL